MREKFLSIVKELASSQVSIMGKFAVSKLAIAVTCVSVATVAVVGTGSYAIYKYVVSDEVKDPSGADQIIASKGETKEDREKRAQEEKEAQDELGLDETGNLNEEKTEEVVESEGIIQADDGSFIDKDGNKLVENSDGTLTTASGTVVKKDTLTTVVSKTSTGSSTSGSSTSGSTGGSTSGSSTSGSTGGSTSGSSTSGSTGGSTSGGSTSGSTGGSTSGGSTSGSTGDSTSGGSSNQTPTQPQTPTYAAYTNLSTVKYAYGRTSNGNLDDEAFWSSKVNYNAGASFFNSEAALAAKHIADGGNQTTIINNMKNKLVNGKYLITDVQVSSYRADYYGADGFNERTKEECFADFQSQGMSAPSGLVAVGASRRVPVAASDFIGFRVVVYFKEV